MRRNSGLILFFFIENLIVTFGLMVALVIVLNGFDLWSSVRFIDNFTERMLAAEGDRAIAFERAIQWSVFGLFVVISIVRALDAVFRSNRKAPGASAISKAGILARLGAVQHKPRSDAAASGIGLHSEGVKS